MYNPRMGKTCGRRAFRLILACFAGISLASAIDTALIFPSPFQDTQLFNHDADIVPAPNSAPADPAALRMKKQDRAFSSDPSKPGWFVSSSGRFNRDRVLLWLLDRRETGPAGRMDSPDLHDRAPPQH
jgi:hypothetical protein